MFGSASESPNGGPRSKFIRAAEKNEKLVVVRRVWSSYLLLLFTTSVAALSGARFISVLYFRRDDRLILVSLSNGLQESISLSVYTYMYIERLYCINRYKFWRPAETFYIPYAALQTYRLAAIPVLSALVYTGLASVVRRAVACAQWHINRRPGNYIDTTRPPTTGGRRKVGTTRVHRCVRVVFRIDSANCRNPFVSAIISRTLYLHTPLELGFVSFSPDAFARFEMQTDSPEINNKLRRGTSYNFRVCV